MSEEQRLIEIKRRILENAIRMYEDKIAHLQDDLKMSLIIPADR